MAQTNKSYNNDYTLLMEINKIYNEDCLETMKRMPDNFIDVIITSPPYNKNFYTKKTKVTSKDTASFRTIDYDSYDDNMNPKDYFDWQKEILKECCRVIKEDGSIFYNHSDILSQHNTIHPNYVYEFPLKQVLIWDRHNTPKLDNNYFYPINEYVFWIKKNKASRTKFYKNKLVYNKSILRLSADKKNNHPAPFPLQLPNNFILSCSDEGGVIYDPFMGSGTTAVAAILNKRKWIGSETSNKYIEIANKRINSHLSQKQLF